MTGYKVDNDDDDRPSGPSDATTLLFEAALTRYIDDCKPGRSIEEQLNEWSLHWENSTTELEPKSLFVRSGCLSVTRNNVTVQIESSCEWDTTTLKWICHASATISKDSKVKERLRKDDYVSKLLSSEKPVLLEANILHSEEHLEERVDCKDDVAEGIRRAILSLADSTLDVFEVLIALPFWPEKNKLGQRARLRLLEDAMCNECEEQENEQAVEELDLGSPSSKKQKKVVDDEE